MQLAQRLYEGVDLGGEAEGLITYMRTDGVQIVPEAVAAIRKLVTKRYGDRYVTPSPRQYETKAKNAQEAHEAIRPTDFSKDPDAVSRYLEADAAKLYKLIWQRTLASQASSAEIERTTADIDVAGTDGKSYGVRATGSVIRFDGFLKIYEEGIDDAVGEDGALPALATGDKLDPRKIEAKQHFTEPPPRYSEATLIKKMEELGIGRPSTYASTLNVLRDREYVRLDKKRLYPEDKGRLVTAFLESFFSRYVEYDFTADLEEKLDLISAGKLEWKDVLRDFWREFIAAVNDIGDLRIAEVLDALNDLLGPHIFPDQGAGTDPRACPSCAIGTAQPQGRQVRRLHRLLELSRLPLHAPARRHQWREGGARRSERCSAPIRRPASRSRSAPDDSDLTFSLARTMAAAARSRSAPRSRKATTRKRSISTARSRFSLFPARWDCIRSRACRSRRASGGSAPISSTTANMRASAAPRKCSRSGSIARSAFSPRRRHRRAAAAARTSSRSSARIRSLGARCRS